MNFYLYFIRYSLWRDTLTDRYVRAEDGVLRLPLDAYEVVWLEPARA